MISQYLKSYNTLDDVPQRRDLYKQETPDQYWHLKTKEYNQFAWYDSIFDELELASIIQIGKSLNLERGNGVDPNVMDYRRSFVAWIPINGSTNWIYERLTNYINDANDQFFQFDLDKIERIQFTYYDSKEDGAYNKHIDPMNWNIPHNRKLSLVVQLSDPDEYEGGELLLHTSKEPTVIKKQKGLTAFFPSYVLHECTPVTKGERYVLVAWVHGPPFK